MIEKGTCAGFILKNLAATERFGLRIGQLLIPGDILLLTGDLGAGKTTLTQSIARGLMVPEKYYVTSPSFALLHEYPGRYPLYHLDCYRLSGEDDIEAAGLSEYLETRTGVCVIEWAARLGSLTPEQYLEVQLVVLKEDTRQVTIGWHGERWSQRIEAITQTASPIG